MAIMIPNFVHEDCKSSAESKMFLRMREELSDKYTILHSLSLSKHQRKLTSEIDFVLISELGVLCIEVKGGRVEFRKGIWYFTDKYNQPHSKTESPFDQASSAMYALRRSVFTHFGKESQFTRCTFGYLVLFPDIAFRTESPEWDLNRVIDNLYLTQPFELLINKQYEYSASEIARVAKTDPVTKLTANQIKELVKYLRGDFCFVPALHQEVDDCYQKVVRLTEEQYNLLEQLEENPRIRIKGGAGTGKTLLAVEEARRFAREGKSVLFLCFNRFLALQIKQNLKNEGYDRNVTVSTFHSYIVSVIRNSDVLFEENLCSNEINLDEINPDRFAEAFMESKDSRQFDCMIIDEGQDLGYQRNLQILDWALKGGINNGIWIWFEDDEQNIYEKQGNIKADFSNIMYVNFRLTKNCRNSKPIAYFTSLSTGTKLPETLIKDGPVAEWICYENDSEQMNSLRTIINKLITGGIKPEEIMILSPCVYEKSVLRNLSSICNIGIQRYNGINRTSKYLHHSTIHSFKGLESKVVIITDVHELEDAAYRTLNYVGFSRANSYLAVLSGPETRVQMGRMAGKFSIS